MKALSVDSKHFRFWHFMTVRTSIFGLMFLFVVACAPRSNAADITRINGTFDGCNYNKIYSLIDGRILVCHEYNYFYAYSPEVIILDAATAKIEGRTLNVTVEYGQIVNTKVADDFDGCDFNKIIRFDNGLLFKCMTYHYHYAYRPDVKIVFRGSTYEIYIAGDKYSGTLYRQ